MTRKLTDGWEWGDLQALAKPIAEQAGDLVLNEIIDSTTIDLFGSRIDGDDGDFSIRAHSAVEFIHQLDGKEIGDTCLCETGFRKLITGFLDSDEDREDFEAFELELQWALAALSDRLKEQST